LSVLSLIVGWSVGIFLFLLGLATLPKTFIGGLVMVAASMIYIPPARAWVYSRTKRTLDGGKKLIILFVAFGVAVAFNSKALEEERKTAEADRIKAKKEALQEKINDFGNIKNIVLGQVDDYIDQGDYQYAKKIIKEYSYSEDPDLMQRKGVVHKALVKEREEKLLNDLATLSQYHIEENFEIYKELVQIDSKNAEYRKQFDYYRLKKNEREAEAIRVADRRRKIRMQFSSWDGSHSGLERYIKNNLKDPGSYEHIETKYNDNGGSVYVVTRYRAKNSFGGYVVEAMAANVGVDGKLLNVWRP
jgi:hypothetical protein